MNVWWQLAFGIFVIWLLWRFLGRVFSRSEPAESVDGSPRRGPFAGVPATKKRGPGNRSGAVALAEPDDDDEFRSYPPRKL
jgi:hypothetical protein